MNSVFTILTCLLSITFFQAKSQHMTYVRGGEILFENKTIVRPKEILSIISKRESPELLSTFKKYRTNKTIGKILGPVGGFGVGYSLGEAIGGGKVNGKLLAGGVGVFAVAVLFDNLANSKLRKLVDLYNDSPINKVSFHPFLQSESGVTKFGLVANF